MKRIYIYPRMEALPLELVLRIIELLHDVHRYDEINTLGLVCTEYHALVESVRDKLFRGVGWVAWLYTKPYHVALYNQAVQSHYGQTLQIITASDQFHIPDIRNNLLYSADAAIVQFLKLRVTVRTLLHMPVPDIEHDLTIYNKELDLLCDTSVQLLTALLDRVVAYYNERYSRTIDPAWSANIKLVENINFIAGAARSPSLAFFHCINRLNTIICHICKVLNSEVFKSLSTKNSG